MDRIMTSNFCSMLPLEIRKDIYELVFQKPFISPQPSRLGCFYNIRRNRSSGFQRRRARDVLALLFVNRQIAQEAWPCFFSKTKFKCVHPMIFQWLKGLGPITKTLITTLEITIETLDISDLDVLSTMPGLRTVSILISGYFDDDNEHIDKFTKHLESPGQYDVCIYNLYLRGPPTCAVGVWQTWSRSKGNTMWETEQLPRTNTLTTSICDVYWAKTEESMCRMQTLKESNIAILPTMSRIYARKT